MLDNFSQKMEIARRFRGLQFDRQSINYVSKTIKDYSQKFVRLHTSHQKSRKITISSRRESQAQLSAVKQHRKTSLCSWMDTNCTISPVVERDCMNTIRVNIWDLNPEMLEQPLEPLQQSQLESLREASKKYIVPKASKNSKGMRSKLVDWLMEVSEELELTKEVLYNAVYYVDKVSAIQNIPKNKYQLLGIASLSLASKLQFQNGQKLQTFMETMDGGCTKQELIDMEGTILKAMKYRLNPPTLFHFLTAILKLLQVSKTKDYMVVNDLLKQENFKEYRELTTYLDLMLLSGDYIGGQIDPQIAALLYVFFGGGMEMSQGNRYTNRFETQYRNFCQTALKIPIQSVKQHAPAILRLISTAQRVSLVTTATLPRAAIRRRSHSYRLKLQAHSRELRTLLPTN